MKIGKMEINWPKIGGICGFIAGIAAIPMIPTISAAAKMAVVSIAPVIGVVGVSTSIGAFLGSAVSNRRKAPQL